MVCGARSRRLGKAGAYRVELVPVVAVAVVGVCVVRVGFPVGVVIVVVARGVGLVAVEFRFVGAGVIVKIVFVEEDDFVVGAVVGGVVGLRLGGARVHGVEGGEVGVPRTW